MEVRLLGPVGICHAGGEVTLARAQQRCVLALVAMNAGQSVPVSTLVDRVWGDNPPPSAVHSLHAHVSRLRKALAQAGSAGGDGAARVTRAGDGYRLEIDGGQVDLHRARRLAVEARAASTADPERDHLAARKLREACGLWRGTPLAGLAGEWAAQARLALLEERLATFIERYRAELRLGEHAAAVGPLSTLLAEHPLAEPVAGLKMLALYRCGRQADALDVYRQVRTRIVAEIGDEPGAELRSLHEQILRRDPALDRWPPGPTTLARPRSHADDGDTAPVVAAAPGPLALTPRQLPADVAGFTGRAASLATLDSMLARLPGPVRIVAISGTPGVGKTALAVHWAHRVADQFGDGQLYVDLRGYSAAPPARPVEVLTRLLHTFGVPPEQLPDNADDAIAAYRSLVADKRVLIVLDDAASAEQVRPLLPGAGDSMVVVTSRHQLAGLVAREGAVRLPLGELPPEEAYQLLIRSAAADRAGSEPESVRQLAQLCGHLPLALRIAAANLAVHSGRRVADLVRQLRTTDRLATLAVPGDARTAVRAAFDLSYARLPEATRQVFRYLALAPGPDVDLPATAALAGTGPGQAAGHLEVLADAHLIQEVSDGRYGMHDLLRVYALQRAHREESDVARTTARDRLADHWLHHIDVAMNHLQPGMARLPITASAGGGPAPAIEDADTALAWLDAQRPNLVAAARHAATTGRRSLAWLLADALRGYFFLRGHMADWYTVAAAGEAAATAEGDACGLAGAELSLSSLRLRQGRHREAVRHAERALRRARLGGWVGGEMAAHNVLGAAAIESGQLDRAVEHLNNVAVSARRSGHRRGEATALGNLALIGRDRGRLSAAAAQGLRALAISDSIGCLSGQGKNHYLLGDLHHKLGDLAQGLRHYHEAALLFRKVGYRAYEGLALCGQARVLGDRGDLAEAVRLVEDGLALVRDCGLRDVEAEALTVRVGIRCRHDAAADRDGHDGSGPVEEAHRAVEIAQAHHDRYVEASALLALALTQYHAGEACEASQHAAQAWRICQQAGFELLGAEGLTLAAAIRLAAGDASAAVEQCRRAWAVQRRTGHRIGEGRTLLVLAAALADPDEAERIQRRAVSVLSALDVPHDAQRRLLLLGRRQRHGQPAAAGRS
jgi:DNA-binding SARP family transcriptional activator/tetratricopeptide (TPR) repeat protein